MRSSDGAIASTPKNEGDAVAVGVRKRCAEKREDGRVYVSHPEP